MGVERRAGRHFTVGTTDAPGFEKTRNPPIVLYPLEASALYMMSLPANGRYTLRHFVLDYGNGAYVVGWFYDRKKDIPEHEMDQNDIEIFYKDTLWNMSRPALHAKKDNGNFIRGPVWLACFSLGDNACQEPQWEAVPTSVIHGLGWHVPTWIFYPNCRRALSIWHHQVYPVPDEGQRLREKHQQHHQHPQPFFSRAVEKPSEQKSPEAQAALQKKYVNIQPKSSDSQLFLRRHPQKHLEEVKTYWRAEAEKLKLLSVKRLVNSDDQWDTNMPSYIDFNAEKK